jgi:competence protein ComEC
MNPEEFPVHLCKVIKIIATFAKNRCEMTVERETAGFALPFAAGVTTAIYAGDLLHDGITDIAATSAAAIYSILIFILTESGRRLLQRKAFIFVTAIAFLTGISCGFNDIILSSSDMKCGLTAAAAGFGERIGAAIDALQFASTNTNALLKAFITGERSGMPEHLTAAFRKSGASHLLALSGFHLGIIYAIVKHCLSVTGNTSKAKVFRSAMTFLICGFYTLATGASPSTVRALIFITLREASTLTHRHCSLPFLTLISMVIQLAASPHSASSISFQLSYAAMAGIAFIYPGMRSAWPEEDDTERTSWNFLRRIWNSTALSISCQLTTAPLAWLYFHTFPKHFLLTNLIALPLAGLVIPGALIALLLDQAGICPELMLNGVEFLVTVLVRSLEIIATM